MVSQRTYEIRDPIHGFVRLDSDERLVLDSPPVQRLRHIHQLAMSYLVYPGATHKRFEHSLGVMELAGRIFDAVTADEHVHQIVGETESELRGDRKRYWLKVLRMAALCHDIGHLPFSHAVEREMLPEGWNHERLTVELIQGESLRSVWNRMRPPLIPEDVAKIAVGPKELPDVEFTYWETLLSEMISGDVLGADRMDYLLRDSHHVGVAYGRFDHYRLTDTMRILSASDQSDEPTLGIEIGGIHSAEALLQARYFMFMQVYLHRVRMAYDLHLEDFLRDWLPNGQFPTSEDELQRLTDDKVMQALTEASNDGSALGHDPANRIVNRNHFKPAYTLDLTDRERHEDPTTAIFEACTKQFGTNQVRMKKYTQSNPAPSFPVLNHVGRVVPSHSISEPLRQTPMVNVGYIFVEPGIVATVEEWIEAEKGLIMTDVPNRRPS